MFIVADLVSLNMNKWVGAHICNKHEWYDNC